MATKPKYKSAFLELEKKFGRLTFGRCLRAWRLADELSQTAFAKKLKISVQNLNDLEKGRKIPSPKRAAKIARALGTIEMGMIQLALRDTLHKDGFKYEIRLEEVS